MKAIHRGFEIDVRREKCMAGYSLLYYSITRESDGYMPVDDYEDSAEKVADMVEHMKRRIDAELAEADPWMEHADGHCDPDTCRLCAAEQEDTNHAD